MGSKFIHHIFVLCIATGRPICSDGDLRLANGRTPAEGRVEICFSGRWGTVCDDNFGNEEARVVCAQQGFQREGELALHVVECC